MYALNPFMAELLYIGIAETVIAYKVTGPLLNSLQAMCLYFLLFLV